MSQESIWNGVFPNNRGRRLILVVGMMQDKKFSAFLNALAPLADVVILTRINSHQGSPRACLERSPAGHGSSGL